MPVSWSHGCARRGPVREAAIPGPQITLANEPNDESLPQAHALSIVKSASAPLPLHADPTDLRQVSNCDARLLATSGYCFATSAVSPMSRPRSKSCQG